MRTRTLLVGLFAAVAALGGFTAPATAAQPAGGVEPYIVGGHNASQNYSFMVSLQDAGRGSHFCGGSLIKSNWVVTAAHCVEGTSPGEVQARVGSTDRISGGTVAPASRIVLGSGDIALVQLARSVPQAPIGIASEAGAPGTATRIIGWGQTCSQPGGCGSPRTLQELDTSVVPSWYCSGINGAEICTDNPNGYSGACYGDSGGPQIKVVSGRWELIGATSRSGNGDSRCATGPSIYTDVTAYTSWIQQHTGSLA
ncbi:serine protease [Longimycelium tulufanense]|uniref:Serine protease n=1 Tax=Longimycelium tulufanense TaxID=907463 RepID=A0A8J3CBB4_9PSEU|nr:serine protease [Longimycelium tulufanense]GGM69119.1 serine protease [Longimycelium tulufanense]